MVLILSHLAYFAYRDTLKIDPMAVFHPFSWQSSVPLCVCTASSLAGHHFSGFCVLAVMNDAATNIAVHVSYKEMFSKFQAGHREIIN